MCLFANLVLEYIDMAPVPQSVQPNVGNRASTVAVKITGDALTAVDGVWFGPDIVVENLVVVGDGLIECDLQIDKEARTGFRDLVATSPGGTGIARRVFSVT